ncbi:MULTISPECIES: hypothetical protein [Rhodomicrobium]|uniref:hypothetical protein n=1 Tax=Rhodomicrobium TaxID=1068 RepID=UPI000F7356AA|nr:MULTISPECIES: hypothetical protein [Rhodomicrobium]
MSTPTNQLPPPSPVYRTERIIASLTMAWVIILTTYMIFQDHALSYTSLYFLKIILSMSGAVMLATLPGFIDINYSLGGFSVRAAGGAAAFVFIFTQSPNLPVLKLDPAQARPAAQRERPAKDPDKMSALTDELPMMVAFSIDPMSILPDEANPDARRAEAPAELERPTPGGSGGAGIGLGAAVMADAGAVMEKAAVILRAAVRRLRAALDAAASALRGGLGKFAATAKGLLGLEPGGPGLGQTIALVTESVSARLDQLTAALLGPEAAPLSSLLGGAGDIGGSLAGRLGDAAGGIVAATDGTVQSLAAGVQDTAHDLLDGTQALAGKVTGLLDNTTGGLTSGLARPVNALVGGLNETAGGLVDGIVPVATGTTSRLLAGVGKGLDTITDQLNLVSPSLVPGLDRERAATPLPVVGKLDLLGNLSGEHGLLNGVADGPLLGNRFADPLGGERLNAGRGCISGCGQGGLLPAVGGGLRDTVGGLGLRQGQGQGGLLGGLAGNGPAAGRASAGEGPAPARGGLISSTVGKTGSLVKGVTGSLGRRR